MPKLPLPTCTRRSLTAQPSTSRSSYRAESSPRLLPRPVAAAVSIPAFPRQASEPRLPVVLSTALLLRLDVVAARQSLRPLHRAGSVPVLTHTDLAPTPAPDPAPAPAPDLPRDLAALVAGIDRARDPIRPDLALAHRQHVVVEVEGVAEAVEPTMIESDAEAPAAEATRATIVEAVAVAAAATADKHETTEITDLDGTLDR